MGSFRLLLAYMVVVSHLSEGTAQTSHFGVFAVFGFYSLSGYLITRILHETYRFDFSSFWTSRVLRLFPIYYVVLAFAVLVITLAPHETARFLPSVWRAELRAVDWFGILTIAPTGLGTWPVRPVPSIWSVGVELLNYAILFAFTARSRSTAIVALCFAVAVHAASLAVGEPWLNRYGPPLAAMLPFTIGALIYFWLQVETGPANGARLLAALAIWIANLALASVTGGIRSTAGFNVLFYVNMLSVAAVIATLASILVGERSRLDAVLGELAYPVFLCHWLVGFALSHSLFQGAPRGLALAGATIAGATAVALVLALAQRRMVEPIRQRLRPQRPSRDSASGTHAPDRRTPAITLNQAATRQ